MGYEESRSMRQKSRIPEPIKRCLRPVLRPYWSRCPLGLFGTNQENPLAGWEFQRPLRVKRAPFGDREEKARFTASEFGKYFRGEVLDVGCDRCQLRDALGHPAEAYTGVDLAPGGSVRADLDGPGLPFRDASFDVVVSLDVLEHLEKIHGAFDELVRCTRGVVIVALPNNWFGYHDTLRLGYGRGRFYGLDAVPPPDRHRWFFNFDDADLFLSGKAKEHGLEVLDRLGLWKYPSWPGWKIPWHTIRRRFLGSPYARNRYLLDVWYVLSKG
jgi:hypothetical protein